MNHSAAHFKPTVAILKAAIYGALATACMSASAGEGFRLRQPPLSLFGGEMAAGLDNPGIFGSAFVTQTRFYKLADANGNDASLPAQNIPLPTGAPTGGAIPNGRYTLNVPAGTIDFNETRTTLNLIGGYLTETEIGGGRVAFAINVPLVTANRDFNAIEPAGTVSGQPPVSALPPQLQGAVGAVAAAVNKQVQAGAAALNAKNNTEVTGFGDTDLSVTWIRHQDRMKVAAGLTLSVPTGKYDSARGPNPGLGYYTLRPSAAVTYNLNPNHTDTNWDAGVTVGGRVTFGMNSVNQDTNYRSGNFLYLEGAVMKVWGQWGLGLNLSGTQQVTDDTGTGAPADGFRYRNYAVGPFLAYKLPLKDAGINLSFSQNFGSRNAVVSQNLQLRFIKSW